MIKKDDKSWLNEVEDNANALVDEGAAKLKSSLEALEAATKASIGKIEAAAKKAAASPVGQMVESALEEAAIEAVNAEMVTIFSTRPGSIGTTHGILAAGGMLQVAKAVAIDLIKQFPKFIRFVR